jgi:hypothetical protein
MLSAVKKTTGIVALEQLLVPANTITIKRHNITATETILCTSTDGNSA